MGRLGPDRGRGRPGRPARPGPQARTSPTAPARAAGTRAGDVASSSARAAGPPGRERGPRSVPGRLIPTVVLSTRPDSARLSAEPPGAQPQRPPRIRHICPFPASRRRISPAAKSEPLAQWPGLVELAVCRVRLSRSVFLLSPDRIGFPKSPASRSGLRPHSASSLAILHGHDSHRAASALTRAPRLRSFCRYKSGCFTRNEYSFTAGLSCKLWPTECRHRMSWVLLARAATEPAFRRSQECPGTWCCPHSRWTAAIGSS